MFPIPIFTIMTSTGVVPLPAGIVKKVIALDYPDNAGNSNSSLAILLNDGRLFTQGANLFGEIADGTRSARFNNFHLASTVVADVFTADRCFVIKTNSGGWQYSGLTAGLVGSIAAGGTDACVTTWTSFPSVITGTISLANLKEVKGGYNNTLWLMNSGVLYGSGQNTVGSLGASTTNEVSTPRQITSAAVAFDAGYNQCSYVNNVGTLRVCGASKGLAGNNNTTTAFVNAKISATETVYVKDYINTVSQTIVVGDTSGGTGTVNYLYVRSNTETTYTKLDTFAAGFSTWKFPPSRHSFFVGINNSLWAIGKNYTANLGLGYDSASGDPLQVGKPVKPEGVGSWDINKLTSVHTLNMDVTNQLGYQGTFFVYNGDMYYSGIWKDGKASYLFNSGLNYNKFTPIASSVITGDILATGLTTDSLGICIVGGTKQLTHSVSPEGGKLFDIKYTSSAPANMTISSTGLMTFHAEGGFDAGMTALNAEGTTLSDTSGGYASTLSVYTPSLSAMDVGTTQTMVAEITPTGAASLPGMVVEYTTTDPNVATVDPTTGVITGVGDGGCRIGCTATYQGVVTASDSSYLTVNAVAGKELAPSPSSSLTVLNGYFNHSADGAITFPILSGTVTPANFVVKVDDVVIPSNKVIFRNKAFSTVDSYPTGEYRLAIEFASASVVNSVDVSMEANPNLLELWGGNRIGYSTSPASQFLKGCANLRRITSDCFSNTSYTGTSISGIFSGCTSLTAIPEGLFSDALFPSLTTMSSTFEGCTSLTSIPSDLFKNLSKVTRYSYTFKDCTSLAEVPAGMFDNIPTKVTSLTATFQGCLALTDFNKIFNDNPGLTVCGKRGALSSFFSGCTNLTGTGTTLTNTLGGVANSYLFRYCTKLSDYNNIPSNYK
ncbi:tail protein [Escherichia phage tuntematon]|uniref:BIG2 domain-containing protein n=3 Tax=root TaxID=1 RepID=A0A6B9X4Z7_9CAUD|nr:tail protein [Escherichia phage tuntematon]QHR71984.1 hypothetical protein tuntematon_128 [Escherichia phage tuntematon]